MASCVPNHDSIQIKYTEHIFNLGILLPLLLGYSITVYYINNCVTDTQTTSKHREFFFFNVCNKIGCSDILFGFEGPVFPHRKWMSLQEQGLDILFGLRILNVKKNLTSYLLKLINLTVAIMHAYL